MGEHGRIVAEGAQCPVVRQAHEAADAGRAAASFIVTMQPRAAMAMVHGERVTEYLATDRAATVLERQEGRHLVRPQALARSDGLPRISGTERPLSALTGWGSHICGAPVVRFSPL